MELHDKLSRHISKSKLLTPFRKLMRESNIFDVEEVPNFVINDDNKEQINAEFELPFPNVFLRCGSHMSVFMSDQENPDDGVGLSKSRWTIVSTKAKGQILHIGGFFRVWVDSIENGVAKMSDGFQIAFAITENHNPSIIWTQESVDHMSGNGRPPVIMDSHDRNLLTERARSGLALAISKIVALNNKYNFVVERSKGQTRKTSSCVKFLKAKDKSVFTLLKSKTIKDNIDRNSNVTIHTIKEKVAHPRRGHWVHYVSDRYVNMKGKKRWKEATWIGPKTWEEGGYTYQVRLDV